jgi:hypothetical protein
MVKKENAEKSIMVGKLKLFNSISKESIIIADDELVNYDVRLWQVVNDDVKSRAIRLEDIEAKRQEKKEIE